MRLGDLKQTEGRKRSFYVLMGKNMGNLTLAMDMSINEFRDISVVRNQSNEESKESIAQREINPNHVKGLSIHILVGLIQTIISKTDGKVDPAIIDIQKQVGQSSYAVLQPFVCNIRNCERDGSDLEVEPVASEDQYANLHKVILKSNQILSVVDGQHRREAFDKVKKFLDEILTKRKYPSNSFVKIVDSVKGLHGFISEEAYNFWNEVADVAQAESKIKIECHLGLNAVEEQQLFADLNNKGKKVEKGLSLSFDKSDAVNAFIAKELLNDVIKFDTVQKDTSTWHEDEGKMLRKDINPITTLAMFGKTSSNNITPSQVDDRKGFGKKFWENVQKIKGFGTSRSRTKTVAAQPVVLKAIAKLANELMYSQNMKNEDNLVKLWRALESGELDFSHRNPVWRSLMLDSNARNDQHKDIKKYVHVPFGTNLDAGTYDSDNKWVRYGAKHNDIYPRIGDLIRYQLKFDPRLTVTKAINS